MSFSEWKEVRLGDSAIKIIDGDRGKNYPNGSDFMNKGYCLFLNAKNVTMNGFLFTEKMFITKDKDKLLRKGKLKRKDIVLTTRGTVGNVAYYNDEIKYGNVRINSGMVILRCLETEVLPQYGYWLFRSPIIQNQILSIRTGSAQPQLPISVMKNLKFLLPPLSEQKAIADTLSCLDDKIELNNRINKTLEEMAQAIFKSWFVDFDPFQDGEFEDSELGRIPKGWRTGTIINFTLEMKNGGTPSRKKETYWSSNDVSWLKTGEINNTPIVKTEEYISFEGLDNSSAKILPINAVVLAMYGATAGKVGILRVKSSTNQACCGMICDSVNKSLFLYLFLMENREYIEGLAVGAAQQNLSKETISKLPIIIPPDEIIQTAPFKELYDSIENLMHQNEILIVVRDSLLPKLMSGEIRVPIEEVQ